MRRRRPEKREILPDPLYNDLLVAKFINNIMSNGKKSLAEKIFYTSIEKIKKSTKSDDGLEVFKKAINNVSPMLEVKSKRIGGATYQVPVEVPQKRKIALAMRWIIGYAKARKGNNMSDRLAAEIVSAFNNEGSSVKKKEDTNKMAEANKDFAHFR